MGSVARKCRRGTALQHLGPQLKAGGWSHPEACLCMHPALGAGHHLEAAVPLHRDLSMRLLCDGFFRAWWLGPQEKGPQGGRTCWKPDHLHGLLHVALPPAHWIHRTGPKVLPRLKRKESRLCFSVGNDESRRARGPEILLWLLLDNVTCHEDLTTATLAVREGAKESRLWHQSPVLTYWVLSRPVFIYKTDNKSYSRRL